MSEPLGNLYYTITLDMAELIRRQREVEARLDRLGGKGDQLQARFTKIAAAITAAISAIAVEGLISKVVTAQRQFDVMFASLKTMTGGADQAGLAFERLRKFAAQTPYTLEQSVKGFVKLKALGLDPSEKAMTSFGNTASAMGKDLMQMIEAVADASTGEFERLKEFGVKARVEGDKVALTFRGTTTTIANNAKSITDYLVKIGETDFAGAMAERMKTLDGDISNLEDSLTALYLTISQSGFGDAIASGVRKATEAIQEASTSIKEGGLTEYFDSLKPLIKGAELVVVSLASAIAGRLVAAMVTAIAQAYAAATAAGVATVAARGFTAVIAALGGPIGIAITGLALLALNWDKVGSQARDAATMSEEAAQRIANALRKSPGRARNDLSGQLKEVQDEMAGIDSKLRRRSRAPLGRTGVPKADPAYLEELRQRRATLAAIESDIKKAIDSTSGGAGRGFVNPDVVVPSGGGGGGGKDTTPKREKFDAAGYLAGLTAQTLDGMARIDAAEQEALRKNQKLLDEKKITAAQSAQAITLIEANAADERMGIQLRHAEDIRAAIEQQGKDEAETRARVEEQQKRGREFAVGVLVEDDPIARLQFELQGKSALLAQYAALDQINAQMYADARVELERQTAERIRQILADQERDRLVQTSAALGAYGSMFESLAALSADFAGKQSSASRALFAVSKAFAIAQGIVSVYSAALQALADPTAITPAQKFANFAAVFAAGAGLLNTIRSAQFGGGRQYGGPAHAGSMYRVNEGGRPEMFTAANGSQYMLPTKSGKVSPAGAGGIKVVVNNFAGVDVQAREQPDGSVMLDLRREAVNAVAADTRNGGPTARATAGRMGLNTGATLNRRRG
jgi:hypothetical protein